jgi:RimJ/RimL family protein N-acetyltransferase
VVRSCWGRGCATDAVRSIVGRARTVGGIERIVAHAPLDRPGSGRVLQKAGFSVTSEHDAVHDGVAMRVQRWELAL